MALLEKIDSNLTGLRYAEEDSIGVLGQELAAPVNTDWVPLEPNTYADFGGSITTVARNPINPSRQRKKGVTTDKDASGGFNTDLTQSNIQELLQGFFFADLRRKGEESPTNVDGTTEDYDVASTTGFFVGSLIFASGFTNSENNGLKRVTAVTLDTSITVAEDLVDETPPSGATIVVVGFQFTADDLDVDASGSLPLLTTTTKDLTEILDVAGEWFYLGGDTAITRFTSTDGSGNEVNAGFMRARSTATNAITVDKSDYNLVTEISSGSRTMQMFTGRMLRNELGSLIKRRTYNLERTLGYPDDSTPADVQAEYILGAVPNELTVNIATADKINADLTFIGIDTDFRTGAQTLKSDDANATKITLTEQDAFNTSSDFTRIRLAKVEAADEAPTPLFAYVTELTVTLNNNNTPNKAIGVLGAFEVTTGTFQIGGSTTAYFADVTAVQSVQNNDDVTLDFSIVKQNAGITVDIPLLSLGDGRPAVEQDAPITLPLSLDAATAAKIDSTLDYTLHMQFYDYLPDVAAV